MTTWLSEYWYVVTGIGGALLVLALNYRARRNADTEFASHWERLKYSAFACAPIGGALILLDAALTVGDPRYSIDQWFFSPYFGIALYAFCWLIAPYLKQRFPLERGKS